MMMRPKEVYYYLPFVDKVANTFVQKIEKNLDKNHALKLDLRVLVAKWSLECKQCTFLLFRAYAT